MSFVRMLPAAWLASFYAALLVVLLVFFLNPGLPFRAATLGGLLPLALLLSLPGTVGWPAAYRFLRIFARRRLRVRWLSFKVLVGFAGANLVMVSCLYWYNLNLLEALIPEALAMRLRVASALLSLFAIALLAVSWFRSWRRLPQIRRACYGVALTLLPGLGLMRGGHPIEAPSPYTPELVSPSPDSPRLLLLGMDGATLDQVLPLVAQGKLPWMGRLLKQGSHGRLTPFRPCVSGVAWESLLTGKLPAKHRVLDASRYGLPLGAGEIRVAPRGLFFDRFAKQAGMSAAFQGPEISRALTLIQILDRLGHRSVLVRGGAGPAGRPVPRAEIRLERFLDPEVSTPPGTRQLREVLRRALEEDEAAGAAALAAWRDPKYRAVAVQLPGLDRVSHGFLRYAMPASFGDVPREEVEKYGLVLERYYRYLDDWIGRFLEPAPSARDGDGGRGPTLVLIVSPHGIEPLPLGRRLLMALEGDRFESGYHGRAPDGIILAVGPGVAHGKPLGKASILDVAPTLLYNFSLPIGMDMDGHPLTRLFQDAFLAEKPVRLIPSYEGSRLSGLSDPSTGLPLTGGAAVVR